jgi:ABC-type bacteriocin/lantibiotic exporter with double-glycine peptidase domain
LFLTFGLVVMVVVIIVLRFTWKRGFETARIESNYKFKTAEALRTLFKVQDRKTLPEIEDQIDYNINQYSEARTQHFGILFRQAWLGIITKVIFTAFMLLIGSYLLVTQKISLGQFLAAEILIITLLDAVEKLILTVENLYDCGISAEKLNVISTIDDTI